MPRKANPDRWKNYFVVEDNGCWRWTAAVDRRGYGVYSVPADGRTRTRRAHRHIYQILVRPLDPSETLDHLCRNPPCVNPAHLDPVPHAVNVARGNSGLHNAIKTHCAQGHPFTGENLVVGPRGWRVCRTCRNEASKAAQRRRRGSTGVHNGAKTHCKRGHEFTPENTVTTRHGRECRECRRTNGREYMRQRRAAAK